MIPRNISQPLYFAFLGCKRALPTIRNYNELMVSQWRSPQEVRENQFERLEQMMRYSFQSVPYYASLKKKLGLKKGWLQSPEDLSRLPLLTKSILLENQKALTSNEKKSGRYINYSSGSTGQRSQFVQDRDFINFVRALQFRGYNWCGDWKIGEPMALIWGSSVHQTFDNWKKRFSRFLVNRKQLDCYHMDLARVEELATQLVKFNPVIISGYTTSLLLIGDFLKNNGLKLERLRAIQPTAELVTPEIRKKLSESFDCMVLNKYGTRETNMIAHQSPTSDNMLIQAENVYLEFLNMDTYQPCQAGEKGILAVTLLSNYSMPLIRYQLGDIGSYKQETDSSGRGLPVMAELEGRLHDTLVAPGGGVIHPQLFSNIVSSMKELMWFQIIQKREDKLTVRLVKGKGWNSTCETLIHQKILALTGCDFDLKFEYLPDIPKSETGKLPLCVRSID